MDREFITSHQIVERYIGGRLPLKGAQDFERFCREHPQLLDEIALTDRINAALRLLEAGGRAAPWEQRAKRWWEQLPVLIGSAVLGRIGPHDQRSGRQHESVAGSDSGSVDGRRAPQQ